MALSVEEGKARRLAGLKRTNEGMTSVQKILKYGVLNRRPAASELKTPLAAVTAARVLHRELETRMTAEGLEAKPGDWGVSIGYVSADLSVIGFTPLFAHGEESALMQMLDGQIMLGLVFGMVDREAKESDRIVMGTRAFVATKQTEAWLSEIITPVQMELEQ